MVIVLIITIKSSKGLKAGVAPGDVQQGEGLVPPSLSLLPARQVSVVVVYLQKCRHSTGALPCASSGVVKEPFLNAHQKRS